MDPNEYVLARMGADDARAELLEIKQRVDDINALFDPCTGHMPVRNWSAARRLLSELKDRVDGWYRLGERASAKDAMNPVEWAAFFPAISDIHCHLDIRRGSRPDRRWARPLGDVQFDLSYWLAQLDKPAFKE